MKIIHKLNKEFRTYGVHLDVQVRFEFALALSQNLEMAHSKDRSYHMLHENACRLPNVCVQQHVEKGVGLVSLVNFFHRLLFVLHVVFIEPSFYAFLT